MHHLLGSTHEAQVTILQEVYAFLLVDICLPKSRDRTSELRKKGFQGRRLGPVQMTTDTAVRVTREVVWTKRGEHP